MKQYINSRIEDRAPLDGQDFSSWAGYLVLTHTHTHTTASPTATRYQEEERPGTGCVALPITASGVMETSVLDKAIVRRGRWEVIH